jgi:hypothetical protein
MKTEYLKLKNNIAFWVISIIFIGSNLYFVLNSDFNLKNYLERPIYFNNEKNDSFYNVLLFHSFLAYSSVLYFSFLSFVLFSCDKNLIEKKYLYNFQIKTYQLLINKCLILLLLIFLNYSFLLTIMVFNIKTIDLDILYSLKSIIFVFSIKFIVNTFCLFLILTLVQYFFKNNWFYLLFVFINIASLSFINKQYSIFEWYVNSLAIFFSARQTRNLNLSINYNSEYLLIAVCFILIFIFSYYEIRKYKQIRP